MHVISQWIERRLRVGTQQASSCLMPKPGGIQFPLADTAARDFSSQWDILFLAIADNSQSVSRGLGSDTAGSIGSTTPPRRAFPATFGTLSDTINWIAVTACFDLRLVVVPIAGILGCDGATGMFGEVKASARGDIAETSRRHLVENR